MPNLYLPSDAVLDTLLVQLQAKIDAADDDTPAVHRAAATSAKRALQAVQDRRTGFPVSARLDEEQIGAVAQALDVAQENADEEGLAGDFPNDDGDASEDDGGEDLIRDLAECRRRSDVPQERP